MFGAEAPASIFLSVSAEVLGGKLHGVLRQNALIMPSNFGRGATPQEHCCATTPTLASEQKVLQDWPSVGHFLDQHTLAGETVLRKEALHGASILASKMELVMRRRHSVCHFHLMHFAISLLLYCHCHCQWHWDSGKCFGKSWPL